MIVQIDPNRTQRKKLTAFQITGIVLGSLGGAVALAASVPILMGFGGAGIVGGSIAAGIQSAIGNVAAGSLFAIFQSAGASGILASTALAGGATAAIGGTVAVAGSATTNNSSS